MSMKASKDIVLIGQVGQALYGPHWQTELARDLEVADRTMRHWLARDADIPSDIWSGLLRVLNHRAVALEGTIERVRTRSGQI